MLAIIIIIAKPLRKAIKLWKSLCLERCPHIGLAKKFEFFYDVMGMGKTRDLFKKIRDTKGTFHAKMGLIKDRNGMDLTEAEDIKKR